jgi:hypothetical protein
MAGRCCQLFIAGTCDAGALCPLMHVNPRKAHAAKLPAPAQAFVPAPAPPVGAQVTAPALGAPAPTVSGAPPSFSSTTWAGAASRGAAAPEPVRPSAPAPMPPRLPAPAPAAQGPKGERYACEEPFRGPCFRTKPCKWHFGGRGGECHHGDLCSFSHDRDSLVRALAAGEVNWEVSKNVAREASLADSANVAAARKSAGASPTRLAGATGLPLPAPAHAHVPATSKARASFRTKLCRHFARGFCEQGDTCSFLHGELPSKAVAKTALPAAVP